MGRRGVGGGGTRLCGGPGGGAGPHSPLLGWASWTGPPEVERGVPARVPVVLILSRKNLELEDLTEHGQQVTESKHRGLCLAPGKQLAWEVPSPTETTPAGPALNSLLPTPLRPNPKDQKPHLPRGRQRREGRSPRVQHGRGGRRRGAWAQCWAAGSRRPLLVEDSRPELHIYQPGILRMPTCLSQKLKVSILRYQYGNKA